MKKLLSSFCIIALLLGSAGCSANVASGISAIGDYSNSTIAAKVTAIDGTKVTVEIGELTNEEPADSTEAPESTEETDTKEEEPAQQMNNTEPNGGDQNNGSTPPEKPEGEDNNAPQGDMQNNANGQPSMPSDNGQPTQGNQNGTVPEKPEGETDGNTTTGEPPEMPEGEAPEGDAAQGNGEQGEMPQGDMPVAQTFVSSGVTIEIDLSTLNIEGLDGIEVGDILTVTFGNNNSITGVQIVDMDAQESMPEGSAPEGNAPQGNGNGGFGSTATASGTAANTIDTDGTYDDVIYASSGDDENALLIDGATVTLNNITVNKNGGSSSNTESGDFYGVNAALLATNGATVTIKNATVTSDAQNGNGVFSYGSGTTVNISDSVITTSADNSGGIQTTGGGTTNATNLTVDTSGNSSAAIRSDRGGGTVNVSEGTYTSNGYNSPAVYSTATITVSDATLTANNSEALVIEGENSITLYDCDVTGNMSDTQGTSSDENVHNVMIYQSMSGDANVGTSTFSMTGGSLTSKNGDMFYITNTNCVLTLTNVTLTNQDSAGYLMRVVGNSASHGWGNAGSNGAGVTFTASNQTLDGDIIVDTISTLNFTLKDSSTFTGTINIVDNAEGGTAVSDNAVVTIESGSTWTLTGDCTITSLTNNGTINYNGYTITLANGTVLSK